MKKHARIILALTLVALQSGAVSAGALLDRLMPYTDLFGEVAEERCANIGVPSDASSLCELSPETRQTLDRLFNGLPGEDVELEHVSSAIRDLLANGLSIDEVEGALPPFVRRQLPSIIRSRHCEFDYSGEVQLTFDNEFNETGSAPYEAYAELPVVCDQPKRFRVVLLKLAEGALPARGGQFYPRSRVSVQLVDGATVTPGTVSLYNDGMLLSDRIFEGRNGQSIVSILALLHSVDDDRSAPSGGGEVVGLDVGANLVIYELD